MTEVYQLSFVPVEFCSGLDYSSAHRFGKLLLRANQKEYDYDIECVGMYRTQEEEIDRVYGVQNRVVVGIDRLQVVHRTSHVSHFVG